MLLQLAGDPHNGPEKPFCTFGVGVGVIGDCFGKLVIFNDDAPDVVSALCRTNHALKNDVPSFEWHTREDFFRIGHRLRNLGRFGRRR